MGALGVAWRMSIELVAALLVGGAVGLGLDRLLGWTPWLMLVGLALGFAAGVRGAVRTAYTMQTPQAPGESPEGLTPAPDDDDED